MKLILNINNQEITVTREEAKKLYKELDQIFGNRINIPDFPIPNYPDWNKPTWLTNEFKD